MAHSVLDSFPIYVEKFEGLSIAQKLFYDVYLAEGVMIVLSQYLLQLSPIR